MAQIPYRANLSAAVFPLTLAKGGRSVIMPQSDQNFDRRVDAPGDISRGSVGIPQILYCENVLPTPDGYQSVGYTNKGTITLPPTVLITSIISTRLPLENSTAFGIAVTDSGDQLGTWTTSPTVISPPVYSQVLQSATVGNPLPSYEMREDETRNPGQQPFMYKEFANLDISTNISFEVQMRFNASDTTQGKRVLVGVACQESGAGIHVYYSGFDGVLSIGSGSSWEVFTYTGVKVVSAPNIAFDAWHKLGVTVVINPDTSKSITATLYAVDGITVLATASLENFPVTNGNYCGLNYAETAHDSPATFASMFWDNIAIAADGIGFESTVQSAVISFLNNNTVRWSHSEVNFENLAAVVPLGFESPLSQDNLSHAFVRGQAFVCIKKDADSTTRIYRLSISFSTGQLNFTEVTATINTSMPSPFEVDDVNFIVGSFNYLILLTKATAFWSSTTTPTDFSPSLVSGAGFGFINNVKANITFAKEHSAGFFIYTPKNVLFAAYTGNARYPWKFREVPGSGGYKLQTQASGDTNTEFQIGVTVTGQLQSLTPDGCTLVAPEVSDFLERSTTYDRFEPTTDTFELRENTMRGPYEQFHVYFLLDRYILIPYGETVLPATLVQYDYVLIYDTQLKRYGKLHIHCNYIYTDEESIFFVSALDGIVYALNFNILEVNLAGNLIHQGVLLLGKFQFVRDRFIQIEEVQLESSVNTGIIPIAGRNFTTKLIPTFNGKSLVAGTVLTPNTVLSTGEVVHYNSHITAKNVSVLVKGTFDLNTLQLTFNPHGRF